MFTFDFETFNENTGYSYTQEGDSYTPDARELVWMLQDRANRLDTGSDDAEILRQFVLALSVPDAGTYFKPGDCLVV